MTVFDGLGCLSFPSAVPIGDLPNQGQGAKVVRPLGRSTFPRTLARQRGERDDGRRSVCRPV